jgi:RNA polymerase sigma-70 factor (ECF subfamily)
MAVNETELKDLMLASLDGDAAAHRSLLERLSRHLRAYYRRRFAAGRRDTEEAEDLVQETLIAIHTRRHTYDRSQPLTPWVFAIARYRLIDHLRHTRDSLADIPLSDAAELLAHDEQSQAESAYDLDQLLGRLPERMRRAIRFVKLDGLSTAEAASRCGTSQSAVKVNVHRGLKALGAFIAQEKKA